MTNEKIATAPDQPVPAPQTPQQNVTPKPVVEPAAPAEIVAPAKAGA